MNIILLTDADFTAPTQCVLHDARAEHIATVLKSAVGDTVKIGLLNGALGTARVARLSTNSKQHEVCLQDVQLPHAPPAPLPITLLLALPRPRMLGRLLRDVTSLGVKNIHLFHSSKVENSFWQTPTLREDSVREYLWDGLTQAKDTRLPSVQQHRRFHDVTNTLLPTLLQTHTGVLADPFSPQATPALAPQRATLLVIGPEGGFTETERTQFLAAGCQPIWLGSRILRVETAVHNAIGRLSHLLDLP